ncbi:fluoride efflux transporter FluC [Streptomyces sp. NPDC051018]|uniref:fluoride efflux transporter FluC n=1 Tax=Streptomyces sp. NPDC051018 TaxID=3365639 RepID=UPI0037BC6DB9
MSPGSPGPGEAVDPSPGAGEAIDPDVDLHVPTQRAETSGARRWGVLAVISVGGVIGALARYALMRAWPVEGFPWVTLVINGSGSALLGVLMVLISEGGRSAHPLVRPFAGVGVLGGFTTFSTYGLDFRVLLESGRSGAALGYAAGTVVCCVGAVWLATALTRRALP